VFEIQRLRNNGFALNLGFVQSWIHKEYLYTVSRFVC
jgi:hypothetical protein